MPFDVTAIFQPCNSTRMGEITFNKKKNLIVEISRLNQTFARGKNGEHVIGFEREELLGCGLGMVVVV